MDHLAPELALQAEQPPSDLAHTHHQHPHAAVCHNCGQPKPAADFQHGSVYSNFCSGCYAEAEHALRADKSMSQVRPASSILEQHFTVPALTVPCCQCYHCWLRP